MSILKRSVLQNMNRYIGFFGTDRRNLFIEDMYKTVFYPYSFVVKYRYHKNHIESSIMNQILCNKSILVGQIGISIFTTKENEALVTTPIRFVKIKNIIDDEETDRVYFYLELLNYCSTENEIIYQNSKPVRIINIDAEEIPFIKIARKLNFIDYPAIMALSGVEELNGKKSNRAQIHAQEDNNYYVIKEGCDYRLIISYLCDGKKGSYIAESNSSDLCIGDLYHHEFSSYIEKTSIQFTASNIINKNRLANILISTINENGNVIILPIKFKIKKTIGKTLVFAVLSTLSLFGITIITNIFRFFDPTSGLYNISAGCLLLIISVVITFFSTYSLFSIYSKK